MLTRLLEQLHTAYESNARARRYRGRHRGRYANVLVGWLTVQVMAS